MKPRDNEPRPKEAAPSVSVIMPCYNYASYLPQAVESVVNQTRKDFELIIINDGSSDSTLEVAGRLAVKYRDYAVKVIDQVNHGVSESRNNGIRAASGRYILPLDADDLIRPTCIEDLSAVLDRFPDIAVAYSHLEVFGVESEVSKSAAWSPKHLRKENFVPICSMFRKDAWEKVGGYKEVMRKGNEDWEFWVSMAEAGYKFMLVDKPLFLWRRHATASRSKDAARVRQELVYTMRCLHPGFFAPIITKYLGAGAAMGYFRLRIPIEKACARAFTGVLYPVYRTLKPLLKIPRR